MTCRSQLMYARMTLASELVALLYMNLPLLEYGLCANRTHNFWMLDDIHSLLIRIEIKGHSLTMKRRRYVKNQDTWQMDTKKLMTLNPYISYPITSTILFKRKFRDDLY